MKEALGLLTAYDVGVREDEFDLFGDVIGEIEHPTAMLQAMTQLAWLLLKSMEAQGAPREDVMAWYGTQFATTLEEMSGE